MTAVILHNAHNGCTFVFFPVVHGL